MYDPIFSLVAYLEAVVLLYLLCKYHDHHTQHILIVMCYTCITTVGHIRRIHVNAYITSSIFPADSVMGVGSHQAFEKMTLKEKQALEVQAILEETNEHKVCATSRYVRARVLSFCIDTSIITLIPVHPLKMVIRGLHMTCKKE